MRIFATCLLLMSLTSCATQLGVRNTPDLKRQMFAQVVFAPDYDSRRTDYLAKWAGPMRVAMKDRDGETIKKYRGTVESQMSSLKKLTDLKISRASENKPGNVTVHFDTLGGFQKSFPNSKLPEQLTASGCEANIRKSASHQITNASIYIVIDPSTDVIRLMSGTLNVELAQNESHRITYCIVKSMIQILGFMNSSDLIAPSIFNTARNLPRPTSLDLQLIRTLYDPALRAGMTRRQALALADEKLR